MKVFAEYERHMGTPVGIIIPPVDVTTIFEEFLREASANMGGESKSGCLERVVDIAMTTFKEVPIYVLCAAIIRGSLGRYGSGRLVPRTVYGWFTEAASEFKSRARYAEQKKEPEVTERADLLKYPVGRAINMKISWLTSGALHREDWEKVPMWQLAEMIGEGKSPTLRDFGLEPHATRRSR